MKNKDIAGLQKKNSTYKKTEIDRQLDILSDIIIDDYIAKKMIQNEKSDIVNVSSESFRFFNGRIGQNRKALSSPVRPFEYERINRY